MRNIYKFIMVMAFLVSVGFSSFAQESLAVSSLTKDASATTWHLFKQVNGVNFYYQYVDCMPIEYINLKVENSTTQAKTINWSYVLLDGANALSMGPDDANVSFSLNASESKSGDCMSGQNAVLQVYVKESGLTARLTTIQLNNITVSN